MIISASRRTDIPAFYSEWFIRRINEGFFHSVNPFNPKKVRKFSLSSKDVDVIVFWSKNPKPLVQYLDRLTSKGYNYYFQFTLNDYPKIFDPFVPPIDKRIETFKDLSREIGFQKVIWRYDPIILSSITSLDYHIDKIYNISRKLNGYTERLVISFLDFYGKVKNRLKKLGEAEGIEFIDIVDIDHTEKLRYLAKQIREIAIDFNLKVFTCAEIIDFDNIGIEHGSCIDINLINDLFNLNLVSRKDKNQRKECLCGESVDMGIYDTCKFQCNYCYANTNLKKIGNNIKKHKSDSPTLVDFSFNDMDLTVGITKEKSKGKQLKMF